MRILVYFLTAVFLISGVSARAEPTFADMAVLLAKGQFKEHVPADASLKECVSFLNKHGICFSLFDLIDSSKQVTKEDFARVLGQSRLLFLGEAELANGCIQRPNEVGSWVDYCLLNDVDSDNLWNGFLRRMEKGPLLEVDRFFGRA
ncbi:MAG: hypothetical protein ISR85_02875 [Kiritimatiellales bacterium]|nr:hypothetical protein [Kiritimatiellota bacterium]MBL7011857.1 hypothetical protein [Kiritimatiellales bacterium]